MLKVKFPNSSMAAPPDCLRKHLRSGLQHLQMDFSGCSQLSDVSALGVSVGELKALQHLQMVFSVCSHLSDVSALGVSVG